LSRARHEAPIAADLCGLLIFTAQFHRFREFGLYEDDYFFIARAMGVDGSYLVDRARVFLTLPQGRPFGFFLPDLLSFIGDKLGGLTAIYVLGFLVVTLNTCLCYRLLRVRVPIAAAAVGAATFALFPVDTTKILLTHDFQLQPALTFALLSGLAYASRRLVLAYPLAAGALLSYESAFLALFALPLLVFRWDRALWREWARHVGVLVGIVALAVVLRVVVGESRASQSVGGVADFLPSLLGSLVLGPLRSLIGMFLQPLRTIVDWRADTVAVAVLVGVSLSALLWRLAGRRRLVIQREAGQVVGAGVAMLVAGYGLAFTHFPPNALVGRGTSVHLGATLGMSVMAAGIAWALLAWRPRVGAALLGVYFALAAGYYVTIQHDFVRSWQIQRGFWQEVVACCSDLQENTVLVYEFDAPETTFIFTNSWADPLVLAQTFRFPSTWANPPRLFSLTEWHGRVEADGFGLRWWVPGASWDEHWEPLPDSNVIVLRRVDGQLQRQTGSVEIAGRALRLKDPGPPGNWPPAPLHRLLLE